MKQPLRVLCTRELQISIADSVHKLLADQIATLGLDKFYEIQQTLIRGLNGSEFIFCGLRSNVTKIKSMEGIDRVWAEEAERTSEDSWQVLLPTIRKDGSEIWVSFNPDQETDPTYRRFVLNPPPDCVRIEIGWRDNPWLSDALRKEMEYLYSIDPEAAAHVWGGQCRRNNIAQVLRGRYVVEEFEPESHWHGPYYGADWGFATDPTALIRCWVNGRQLYLEH